MTHVMQDWEHYILFCGVRADHRTNWLFPDQLNRPVTCPACASFICTNCRRPADEHADQQCLFHPTTFNGMVPR